MTTKLRAPSTINPGTPLIGGAAAYTVDANGFVSVQPADVGPLLTAGFTLAALPIGSQAVAANGLTVTELPVMTMRTATGLVMTATAGAGVFGISLTPGSSLVLTGEVASSNTKTDKVVAEFVLPPNYVAGTDLTLTVNAKQTGVATVKTIDASAWLQADAGTQGSDLVTTNAQSITTSAADYAFAITGTDLLPGSRLVLQLTSVSTEAAAGNTNAAVNSIRIS